MPEQDHRVWHGKHPIAHNGLTIFGCVMNWEPITVRRRSGMLLAILFLATLSLVAAPQVEARPGVQARTWIIMDADTGEVLDGVDPHQQTAMASLTKVMTALIAIERGDLEQRVRIVESDLVGEASAGLRADEEVSLRTLLYGLLLRSGNDAAMAIARAVGGSPQADDPAARTRFIEWMNARAAELGLTATHFTNPHGLDASGHTSSVADLAILTRAAIASPAFVAIFGAPDYRGDGHSYEHGNQLPKRYPGVIGGKTGWTRHAGLCLIEVAERDGRRLIVVLIGSTFERWYDDAIDLFNYGWSLPSPGTTPERAAAVFAWWRDQTDRPVSAGAVHRTWIWGPAPAGPPRYEPYDEAPGGSRIVQYFDKGRMEITYPGNPLGTGWYVTGGRLAWEMIAGQRQVGEFRFEPSAPAVVPLAGDPDAPTPNYATLRPLLDAPAAAAGAPITARLLPDGSVVEQPSLGDYGVTAGTPDHPTGHGVASVFNEFLGQHGPIFVQGNFVDRPLFDPPFSVTGFPITEAYWLRVPVAGVPRDVLVQCFERRCLTYTPSNPPGWQVEMGNIGLAYQHWVARSASTTTVRHLAAPAVSPFHVSLPALQTINRLHPW